MTWTRAQPVEAIELETAAERRHIPPLRHATPALSGSAAGDARIAHARWHDLPALARLQRRSFTLDRGYGLLTCLALRYAPRTLILVARAAGAPVGMLIADLRVGKTPHARILNVCVAPEHRRRGYGRALLLNAEALLPTQRIVLMVDQHNAPAITLYEQLGYRQVGLEPDYYGRTRHAYVMQKERKAC